MKRGVRVGGGEPGKGTHPHRSPGSRAEAGDVMQSSRVPKSPKVPPLS